MEMDTSTKPPEAPSITVEDKNTSASRLREVTLDTLQTLEQPEERDVWSMEEGDDSVFYSDDDQTQQDAKENTSCDLGADKCEHPASSETAEESFPRIEGDPGAELISDNENLLMEKEVTRQLILTEQEDKCQELQTKTEIMNPSDSADPGAEDNLTPEKSVISCEESSHPKGTNADMQRQPEQNISLEIANTQVKEEVMAQAQMPNLEPSDKSNEEGYTRLNGEASAKLQVSGNRHLEVEQAAEQDENFHVPEGFHQGPSPGCSTLPLEKKSFDHLRSSKYSTVSYRRICRGNTRQKIEEFEYKIMNS
ncbi:uncharacterized protein ermn [Mastacembelus armatus]|uniref:uncharacterized protein ermn n=1 Tax=Mastacembelus armatus TaxID=205130 RepID=UPI000E457689|nr:uncharacterized protein LOC113122976 [Mastacembelus armatus]